MYLAQMRSAALASSLAVVGACGTIEEAKDVEVDAAIDSGADPQAEASDHSDAAASRLVCQTIGRTGPPTSCRMFAYCGHAHFEIDCSAVVSCTCRELDVDASDAATRMVVYESVFCESPDGGDTGGSLGAAFEAATRACGWSGQH